MATLHPHLLNASNARDDARIRRWCVLAIAAAILLAAYAGGVAWVTRHVEAGVDRSLQPISGIVRDGPGA
jgi:hypothetical protein